jgi:hypothetical protein
VTELLNDAQGLVLLAVGVGVLALAAFALVEAARYRGDAYTAAGKQTKPLWLALTAVGAALGFISVFNPLALGGILAAGVAVYFLVAVRPALAAVQGRGRGGRSNDGPYGTW